MATYPNVPGIEVSVQDGGLILPDTATTESLLVIAPCQSLNPPVDPLLTRNSTDAITNYGGYTDANGVINPLTAAWKIAFEGGSRRTYLLPLAGATVKDQFLSLRNTLFGPLADFSVDNIALKDVYADVETPVLTVTDFPNVDDTANFPNLSGIMKYGYKVASKSNLVLPVTIAGSGTAQVETATVGTTSITTSGNFDVKVTGAGITGSPLTIPVAVTAGVAEVASIQITNATGATSSGNVTVTLDGTPTTVALSSGLAEVASLQITNATGATTAGNVTVTLDGVATTVAVLTSDNTAALVATKIRATTFAGWTTGGATDTVTFTATTIGNKVDAVYSAGTTGAAGTMTTTTQGLAADNTAALVATKIRATVFTGWTTSGATDTVIFTATTVGNKVDAVYSAGTTGATGIATTTTQGVAADNTAALVATKVRAALTANAAVSALYTISGATASVVLTRNIVTINDATLNVELFANTSTAVGSVNVPTSTHTTASALVNASLIINDGTADRTINLTSKTYDGTIGKTLDDLAADIQAAAIAANVSLAKFKSVAENGKLLVLGDIAYTVKPGSVNDVTAILKFIVTPAVTSVATKSRHDKGTIIVGNFAELLRDYCEDQTVNHNTVKGFIGVTPPASASLVDIKANVDRLAALVNEYSGHVSIVSSPELGYAIPGKNGYYYCNGVVTYAALVSTLTPQSAPTNKPVAGAGTVNYNLSLRQMNQLSGNKYVSFRVKNGAIYVTDGITTAPDLIVGGIVQASDYTRLSTLRITHAAINLVREVADPFVGEPNGMAQSNALNSAIKAGLEKMKGAGAIQDYRFSVIPDRGAGVLGQSKVTLQIIPAFENRKIVVAVSLATQLK